MVSPGVRSNMSPVGDVLILPLVYGDRILTPPLWLDCCFTSSVPCNWITGQWSSASFYIKQMIGMQSSLIFTYKLKLFSNPPRHWANPALYKNYPLPNSPAPRPFPFPHTPRKNLVSKGRRFELKESLGWLEHASLLLSRDNHLK